jgi:fatty acid desaturase
VYRFTTSWDKTSKGEFYIRQILGSVNYNYGNDVVDYLHGYLNYQIEHHVFPDLSMYAYQKIAPEVRAICRKHDIPYIKENVLVRLGKTVNIMVGVTSMKQL